MKHAPTEKFARYLRALRTYAGKKSPGHSDDAIGLERAARPVAQG